jgi:phage/conjugal plasmid C-4 type zinc finger TraR family protein
MTDVADDAQLIEEAERQASIERVLACEPEPRAEGDTACKGCGDEIDPERREALPGARRCLQCQEACERANRLFRKFA